jgi:hypothetical protein
MGQGNIKEASTQPGSRILPQQTPPAQPENPVLAGMGAGTRIGQIPDYAQQPPASPSSSIPPPEQMNALGPPLPERSKMVLSGGLNRPVSPKEKATFLTVTGIGRNHPLAKAVLYRLKEELRDRGVKTGKGDRNDCEDGTTISLELGNTDEIAKKTRDAYNRTCCLVVNLKDLGIGPKTAAKLIFADVDRQDLSARSWHLPKKPSPLELAGRRQWIDALAKIGAFEQVVFLLSDLAKVHHDIGEDLLSAAKTISHLVDAAIDGALAKAKYPATALKVFKEWVCSVICNKLGEHGSELVKAGKIVLMDIMTVDSNCSELQPYQLAVFKNIADAMKKISPDERSNLLRELFYLPDIDRYELFGNPKARMLLLDVAGFSEFQEDFDKADQYYHEVFFTAWKRLKEKFVMPKTHSDTGEILARSPYTDLAKESINLFFKGAEAACVIGLEMEAIAVLRFLAGRKELSDEQKLQLKTLSGQIQMSVRFSPLSYQVERFDDVKKQTDAIIAQAFGEQKPDPGV